MSVRNRHYFTLALVGLVILGNALAEPQFREQRPRAPRQHHHIPAPPTTATQFGDPLADLTKAQLADFAEGLDEFASVDTVESGLGPVFNNVSCLACHSQPA